MEMTSKCVYCLKKPAKIWSGHVVRGKKTITAGWCGRYCQHRGEQGFSGHYKWRMRRKEDGI